MPWWVNDVVGSGACLVLVFVRVEGRIVRGVRA